MSVPDPPERLTGIFAAAPTPVRADLAPDLGGIAPLYDHLAGQGCHGALVLGTTGEGPSFGLTERAAVLEAVAEWRARGGVGAFRLLAGTGCSALSDTIEATRTAFALGFDGVVALPPFFYKAVGAEALGDYYARLADAAVPTGGRLLLYHLPRLSGVAIPTETVAALSRSHPRALAGMKDSGGDLAQTRDWCRSFSQLAVFTGNDRHLVGALAVGGAGSITALANSCGALARAVWDAHRAGQPTEELQARLSAARSVFDAFPSVAAAKALLAERHGLPRWPVRPPLQDLDQEAARTLCARLEAALAGEPSDGEGRGTLPGT